MQQIRLSEENRRWWTLGAMCFALFMLMLDNTVVNVALPSIQRSLRASTSGLEWTVNAYTLALAVLMVTGGRLGDLFGRVRIFIAGVVLFTASSAAIGFSPDATFLVVGRAVQGVGAAMMMPGTLSIIANAFPPQERGRAIGIWAGVSAVALALGPVIGGFLVEHVSWQSIFFLNVPIGIAAVFVTLFSAHESRDETVERVIDIPGVVSITAGLGALTLALVQANHWGWGSPAVVGLLVASIVLVAAFCMIEQRTRVPMVDFSFFRSRSFAGSSLAAFCVTFAMMATFFFITLYMQNVLGYTPLEAGVRFLPMTIILIVMGPVAGKLTDSIGPRRLMAAGMAITAGALLWQSFLQADSTYGFLLAPFMVQALGMGLVMSPMNTAAMNAVVPTKAGVASGILGMSRMIGATFGVAALGALIATVGRSTIDDRLPRVPATVRDRLAESLGTAPPDGLAPRIASAANEAFVSALHVGLKVGAGVALLGALLAFLTISDREDHTAGAEATVPESGRETHAVEQPAFTDA